MKIAAIATINPATPNPTIKLIKKLNSISFCTSPKIPVKDQDISTMNNDPTAIKKLHENIASHIGQPMALRVGLDTRGEDPISKESLSADQRMYRDKLLAIMTVYSEQLSDQFIQDKKALRSKCKIMMLADLENLIPPEDLESIDYYFETIEEPGIDYDFLSRLEQRLFDLSP